MEAFVNQKKVKVNTEIGRWLSLGGLLILIAGLIVSIAKSELVLISFASLIVGFLCTTIGAYYANRWTRTPRPDQVLSDALKGISNQYHFYHYLLPVPHVLLGPSGFYLFRAYVSDGKITFDGKRWGQKFSWLRFLGFSGQDALGDPEREALYDAQRFRRWLGKRMPESDIPEIVPIVVFVRENVELDIAETAVPVIAGSKLKRTIRSLLKERPEVLTTDRLYNIEQAMFGDKIDEL
ncbi:MAG: hypothetical protein JW934_06495 [Anaerolineae bacterium]|nr:hypothetical protein [Anaerolineae bacterium]